MIASRIQYYLSSIPTILGQVENWYACVGLFFRQKPVVIRLRNGCSFKVRSLMDVWIIKETCLDRDYEANSLPIEGGWNVMGIGAGIGDFSILIAREHPDCRVYAYEPSPESFDLFVENLDLNVLRNVSANKLAVGSKTGRMMLTTVGESVQHTTTNGTDSGNSTSVIEVQGISLDDVFRTHALTRCHFLKMDCEGGEYEILFNTSQPTLEMIDHICLEYHDGFTEFSHSDLVDHLAQRGYKVKVSPNPVHRYLGFLYACR